MRSSTSSLFSLVAVLWVLFQGSASVDVLFEAPIIDYAFPSPQARQNMIQSGRFIPENNALAGVKVYNGSIFVTIPRWRSPFSFSRSCLSMQADYLLLCSLDIFGLWMHHSFEEYFERLFEIVSCLTFCEL
jgi:hypothetical protein